MTRTFAAATLMLIAATAAHAQADTTALVPGARVRVHQGPQSVTGSLVSLDSTSLVLVTGKADTMVTPRASITGVDVSRGTKSRAGRGALIGLGVGTVAGIVTGLALGEEDSGSSGFMQYTFSKGQAAVGLGLAGAVVGAGIGAVIGATQHGDRWEPTVLPTFTAQPAGRVALGLQIRF